MKKGKSYPFIPCHVCCSIYCRKKIWGPLTPLIPGNGPNSEPLCSSRAYFSVEKTWAAASSSFCTGTFSRLHTYSCFCIVLALNNGWAWLRATLYMIKLSQKWLNKAVNSLCSSFFKVCTWWALPAFLTLQREQNLFFSSQQRNSFFQQDFQILFQCEDSRLISHYNDIVIYEWWP